MQVPGADALQPGDFFGLRLIRGPDQVPAVGAGAAVNPLVVDAGHHIGMAAVEILRHLPGIKDIVPHRQDHRAHRQFLLPGLVREIDGVHRADLGTQAAVGAGVLINGVEPGHGLGKGQIGRRPLVKAAIKLIDGPLGADLGALAAGRAGGRVDEPGPGRQPRPEIARLSVQGLDLSIGKNLDIAVAPRGHAAPQTTAAVFFLWGNKTHGAVVGGKGLVQLRHQTPEHGRPLRQVDAVPGTGQIHGRLETGHAAAHNQHRADFGFFLNRHTLPYLPGPNTRTAGPAQASEWRRRHRAAAMNSAFYRITHLPITLSS